MSSKLSLLTIASTCLENKSSFKSNNSASLGNFEAKEDGLPCINSMSNSGVSFIILIFMFRHSELPLGN